MRLPKFDYVEPKSLKEAARVFALQPKGSAFLAGGTDLLVRMKYRVKAPTRIINLKTIPRLARITDGRDGVRIGALATLDDLASSPVIQERYPSLAHACREVGAYGHQVMGTMGGNLCQENRCRFFNQSVFWRSVRPLCFKAGGEICHVVRKARECHSTYCGDLAPVLIALGAEINLLGPNGERRLPLRRLYTGNGAKPLSLKKGEILREVFIPSSSGETVYLKWRLRDSLEYPIVSVAVSLDRSETRQIKKATMVFSGVGPDPVETVEAEKTLKGGLLDDGTIDRTSAQAVKEISPMRTSIHSPAYKRKMAGILLGQALEKLREL